MALRSSNLLKSVVTQLKGSNPTATAAASATPKPKAFATAAGVHHPDTIPRPIKGEYVPVYVAIGMILMSAGFGTYTAMHQLRHSPDVYVKKSKRESLPEVREPEEVVDKAEKFIKKSFFRKVAHVQDFDRHEVMRDPIRGDALAREPHVETLKSVGVDPKSGADPRAELLKSQARRH